MDEGVGLCVDFAEVRCAVYPLFVFVSTQKLTSAICFTFSIFTFVRVERGRPPLFLPHSLPLRKSVTHFKIVFLSGTESCRANLNSLLYARIVAIIELFFKNFSTQNTRSLPHQRGMVTKWHCLKARSHLRMKSCECALIANVNGYSAICSVICHSRMIENES